MSNKQREEFCEPRDGLEIEEDYLKCGYFKTMKSILNSKFHLVELYSSVQGYRVTI